MKEEEVLGSPDEPLGGPREKFSGTERTVALAKGQPVAPPGQKGNPASFSVSKRDEEAKSKEKDIKQAAQAEESKRAAAQRAFMSAIENKQQAATDKRTPTGFGLPSVAEEDEVEVTQVDLTQGEDTKRSIDAGKKSLADRRALQEKEKGIYTGPKQLSHAELAAKSRAMRAGVMKAIAGPFRAFVENKDFRGALMTALGLGLAPVAGALSLTPTAAVSIPSAANAYGATKAVESIVDAIDPGPPSTALGYAKEAIDYYTE